MEHYFELTVPFEGEERIFNGRLVTFAYAYKFYIVVDGSELVFERDDDGNYRVINQEAKSPASNELLQAIIRALEQIQK